MRYFIFVFVAVGGFFSITSAAFSGTVHQLQISNGCTANGTLQLVNKNSSDGTAIAGTAGGSNSGDGCTTTGSASAGMGYLSTFLDTNVAGGALAQAYDGAISGNLSSRYSNIQLTTPAGYSGGPVSTALSFDLSAFIGGSTADGTLPSSYASSVGFSVFISASSNILAQSFSVGDPGAPVCPPPGCSQSINSKFTTGTFSWDPSTSLVVSLFLNGSSTATAFDGGTSSSRVNAQNTLSFSESGAFVLPDGFSVTYAEANIFNNNWVDPRPSTPTPIPLPASFPLLLAGLGAFALIRRRQG